MQVKSAPELTTQKAGNHGATQQPLANIGIGDFIKKFKEKFSSPPPTSAADLGFLKKDIKKLGSFIGGGEAKAAELEVFICCQACLN